jgi:hypothetical protein
MFRCKIEKNEMGGACSADGRRGACIGFWWGNLRERDQWGDPGIDGRIILRWIFRSGMWGMDWIELAHDRQQLTGSCESGNEPWGSIKRGEFP